MTEYLIQRPSGHVYVATTVLRERKDMRPYVMPGTDVKETAEKEPEATGSIDQMTKKELEDYARKHFDVELDRRKRRDDLLAEVKGLEGDTTSADFVLP